jgi:CheY-like chemotaxis protein
MAPAKESATYRDRERGDGVRVLLAENDAALQRLIAAELRNANDVSTVVEADDGASAVSRALHTHTHPHVPLFDNQTPRLSDIDPVLQLRKQQLALLSKSTVRG